MHSIYAGYSAAELSDECVGLTQTQLTQKIPVTIGKMSGEMCISCTLSVWGNTDFMLCAVLTEFGAASIDGVQKQVRCSSLTQGNK